MSALQLGGVVPEIPASEAIAYAPGLAEEAEEVSTVRPWPVWLAVGLGLTAQLTLEPGSDRSWSFGVILYLLAAASLVLGHFRFGWDTALRRDETPFAPQDRPYVYRNVAFLISLPLGLVAFLAFGGNRFTTLNVTLWVWAVGAFCLALWQPAESGKSWWRALLTALGRPRWSLSITRWGLLVLAVVAIVVFYRFYQLEQVPAEMVSDHAEKLLDVWDVLHGETRIFFPRNTGREGLQMYLTAAIIQLFGTGYSFLSLKLGTVLAGLLALPFMYALGVEIANRRVGLLALFFAGIAYWPNVISRVGLRFPLYLLFVAPTLFFLVRGLRRMRRNDFILAGLSLGIGLHGYTPIRILPFLILIAVLLFVLHRREASLQREAFWGLILIGVVSLLVFLPLLRFALEDPALFAFRSFSRLGTVERELPGPAWQIFLGNLWRASTMFAWDNGEIWVHSIMHRPALDVVAAAFYYLGVALLLVRYLRRRNWLDLFLLLSIPILQLPSILSLAFPAENPSLNRMSGAIVPVFLIAALAMDGFLSAVQRGSQTLNAKLGLGLLVLFLAGWSAQQNYDLVFNQYADYYRAASWNTSEMGEVIHDFTHGLGVADNAYVVAFPHWVDTRLVGMNAGYPLRDLAIWPEAIGETTANPGAKLFLVKPEDEQGQQTLRSVYPAGIEQMYLSRNEGHDFIMYFVLPVQ